MPDPQGGYLQMLPVFLPEGMTVTGATVSLLPWTSPAYYGLVGTSQSPPEPVIVVSYEWPFSWLRTVDEIPKFQLELLHIRRFSSDQALATGTHAFSNIQPGGDPPDSTVTTDQGVFGVECTSLTVQNLRGVHSLFRTLRRRVLEQEPSAFTKLAGNMIYVWFQEPGKPGLARPFRQSDDQAATMLLQELADYQPKPHQIWVPGGNPPQQAPPLPLTTTPQGASFYAVPLIGNAPSSMLFTFAGFELGVAYTSFLTVSAVRAEVQRLVSDHDKPGVDVLLITSGAPDRRGDIYPAEEAVASFMRDNQTSLALAPKHVKRIWLYSWMTGHANELYPNPSVLFGPLYQSLAPAHHPLISTQPVATSERHAP